MPAQRVRWVVSAAVLVSMMSSCAIGQSGATPGLPSNAAAVQTGASLLGQLRVLILGTVAQRSAGELVMYHHLQDPLRDCLTAAGFEYVQPKFDDIYQGRNDQEVSESMDGLGWFARPGSSDFRLAENELVRARVVSLEENNAYLSLGEDRKKQYGDQLNRCRPSSAAYGTNFPPNALQLNDALNDVLGAAADIPALKSAQDKYPACLSSHGFRAENPSRLVDAVSAFPARGAPVSGRSASTEWAAASERAHTAADADAVCRRDIYNAGMTVVAPRLDVWRRQHEPDLAQIQAGWAAITKQAAAYPSR